MYGGAIDEGQRGTVYLEPDTTHRTASGAESGAERDERGWRWDESGWRWDETFFPALLDQILITFHDMALGIIAEISVTFVNKW